jgi:hypothetical protein
MSALELKEILYKKIENSNDEIYLKELLDFAGYLQEKKAKLENSELNSMSMLSLEKVWDNEEDAIYDKYLQEV